MEVHQRGPGAEPLWGSGGEKPDIYRQFAAVKCFPTQVCCWVCPPSPLTPKSLQICANPKTQHGRGRVAGWARGRVGTCCGYAPAAAAPLAATSETVKHCWSSVLTHASNAIAKCSNLYLYLYNIIVRSATAALWIHKWQADFLLFLLRYTSGGISKYQRSSIS